MAYQNGSRNGNGTYLMYGSKIFKPTLNNTNFVPNQPTLPDTYYGLVQLEPNYIEFGIDETNNQNENRDYPFAPNFE
jgi:hypothetical protein